MESVSRASVCVGLLFLCIGLSRGVNAQESGPDSAPGGYGSYGPTPTQPPGYYYQPPAPGYYSPPVYGPPPPMYAPPSPSYGGYPPSPVVPEPPTPSPPTPSADSPPNTSPDSPPDAASPPPSPSRDITFPPAPLPPSNPSPPQPPMVAGGVCTTASNFPEYGCAMSKKATTFGLSPNYLFDRTTSRDHNKLYLYVEMRECTEACDAKLYGLILKVNPACEGSVSIVQVKGGNGAYRERSPHWDKGYLKFSQLGLSAKQAVGASLVILMKKTGPCSTPSGFIGSSSLSYVLADEKYKHCHVSCLAVDTSAQTSSTAALAARRSRRALALF